MPIQTVTSRTFNQDPTGVKRAACSSPVQITDRGRVSHVLLSIDKYEELIGGKQNIVDMLSMPGNEVDIFDVPKLNASSINAAEFD